ncbi:hypothetical protein HWQ46_21315 [Shewanella sp. D64]|uniref:hypothetical protein n=1 Tax=unclassified Shewanella TaxID=196818 RepID=UPI0022BA501C|nr:MULTISPECIES: hypothetical protein [unclassified Shewanella]MEC4728079.1 hypothetical protein [Shewanella sp. D64]MEC4738163.1 hypothetical protein [Shewanella sp. E94]WBJ96325.1 hypothetical protein HWQ47_04155 [Shewanella sp. MTB7]
MLFNKTSSTKAVITNKRFNSISRKVIGGIIALITIVISLGLRRHDEIQVIYWAFGALLSWHLLFAKMSIEVDLNKQLISTEVNSLYPVAKQEISIENIKAFSLHSDPTRVNNYNLLIISNVEDKPFRFNFGSQAEMNRLGQKIAQFCGKPFLT